MCQLSESAVARTQPEPRKPGKLLARSIPCWAQWVASWMRVGSTRRVTDTVMEDAGRAGGAPAAFPGGTEDMVPVLPLRPLPPLPVHFRLVAIGWKAG